MPRQLQRIFSTLAFICVATASFAQSPGGQIRGTVTDETGGTLPGVTAEARLLTGGITVSAVTDGAGAYSLEGLAPGRYLLTFTLINFATVGRRDIDIGAGVTTE